MGETEKQTHTIIDHITKTKVQLAITIISTIFLVINALITFQLAPLAQDIVKISQDVSAIEKEFVPKGEVESRFDRLDSRLDRIESNQDLILRRLN